MLYGNDNETVDRFDVSKKIIPNLIYNILFAIYASIAQIYKYIYIIYNIYFLRFESSVLMFNIENAIL